MGMYACLAHQQPSPISVAPARLRLNETPLLNFTKRSTTSIDAPTGLNAYFLPGNRE